MSVSRNTPRRRPGAEDEPQLWFCANCQVSVSAREIERGAARRTPRGRVFCPLCTHATPAGRRARRQGLEAEFADDAPIADPDAGPPPLPPLPPLPARPAHPPGTAGAEGLEERVAQLERVVAELEATLRRLEGPA